MTLALFDLDNTLLGGDSDHAWGEFLSARGHVDAEAYRQAIVRIHDYIQAGDCYQVNFAQRFRAPYQGSPWTAYQALRAACPTPFSGYLSLPEQGAIISLSPERFMRISQGQYGARQATPRIRKLLERDGIDAIINGTGVGQPLGILASAGLVCREGHLQPAATALSGLALADVVDEHMAHRLGRQRLRLWLRDLKAR